MKKIGYSFWGFLSDVKLDKNGNELSTPDGNAYYSWAIINSFQKLNYQVIAPFPNRDIHAYSQLRNNMFGIWANKIRANSYNNTIYCDFPDKLNTISEQEVFDIWDNKQLNECEFILHEWRMEIPNRNLLSEKENDWWQPDLFLQVCLINYCKKNNIKLFVFDLDNKLDKSKLNYNNYVILELGNKWSKKDSSVLSTPMPFNIDCINQFKINNNLIYNMIYIGNRYERDWCIDKYIPTDIDNILIYGNWLEGNKDSASRWPKLTFKHRIQQRDMLNVYNNSVCTILLAKQDYCDNNIMTGRVAESVLYGTIPLFISEYSKELRELYGGIYFDLLTVHNKEEVAEKISLFKENVNLRRDIIEYLRENISNIMDSNKFVKMLIGENNE